MIRRCLFLILLLSSTVIIAQNDNGLTISGFVRADAIYDTRQNVEAREGYLLLYPLRPNIDKNGVDINDKGTFSQYAMISRLRVDYRGIDILKAKTKAYIEMDFSGSSNLNSNTMRMRHAYIEMKWPTVRVLVGQYWHPFTVPEVFPRMLSLNTGAPFHAFNRSPQMRLDWQTRIGKFIFVAVAQRDFSSKGINGVSPEYLRNSGLPNFNFQYHIKYDKYYAGVGVDWKKLVPRISKNNGGDLVSVDESISSLSLIAFAKADFDKLSLRVQGVYGENLYEQLMLGGYRMPVVEPSEGSKEYSNISQNSVWGDVNYKLSQTWNIGVFSGYSKNQGAEDDFEGVNFSRGSDVDYLYRIAPRVSWKQKNLSITSECEVTTAAYGDVDQYGNISDSEEVTNIRTTISVVYNF